jgi:hypothetical protein
MRRARPPVPVARPLDNWRPWSARSSAPTSSSCCFPTCRPSPPQPGYDLSSRTSTARFAAFLKPDLTPPGGTTWGSPQQDPDDGATEPTAATDKIGLEGSSLAHYVTKAHLSWKELSVIVIERCGTGRSRHSKKFPFANLDDWSVTGWSKLTKLYISGIYVYEVLSFAVVGNIGATIVLENRPAAVAGPSPGRAASADRPAALRARATNDPLRGRASRNTAQGRRIGDLFDAYIRAMGNPTDALAQANALAAAELKVAAEDGRAKLLSGGDIDPDQVVKLEGAAARADRKLGIAHRAPEVVGMTLGDVLKRRRDG